jgi:hypothetical protein
MKIVFDDSVFKVLNGDNVSALYNELDALGHDLYIVNEVNGYDVDCAIVDSTISIESPLTIFAHELPEDIQIYAEALHKVLTAANNVTKPKSKFYMKSMT